MKRLIIIPVLLFLAYPVLTACVNDKKSKKEKKRQADTTVVEAQIKSLFERRVNERLVQLEDFVYFIQNEKTNSDAKTYYAKRASRLFAPGSKTLVKTDNEVTEMPVDSFFLMLADGYADTISIDSVFIPTWSDILAERYDSAAIIQTEGKNVALSSHLPDGGSSRPVPVNRIETEDGDEWSIYLGDMTVRRFPKELHDDIPDISWVNTDISFGSENWDDVLYDTRVKLVDEFFARFNGNESRIDVDINDKDSRLKNLLLLFDSQLFKSFDDPLFTEAKRFAATVMASGVKIDYADTAWVAKATCSVKLKGKPSTLSLYLNVQERGDDMYKWVIAKAEGKALDISSPVVSGNVMLMPDAHETDFMSLYRITTEKDNYIMSYAGKGFVPDPTTTFFSYVYSGLLDIEHVTDLEFTFLQVPGYVFTIKNLIRDTYNAGWLITSFSEVTDAEKKEFLKTIYR